MATFKTASGERILSITVNTLAVVHEAMGIHLAELEAGTPPLSVRLRSDPILIGTVVFHCLRASAAKQKPPETLAEFLDELHGEHLVSVQDALGEALTDFFRRSGRVDLAAIMDQTATVMKLATDNTVAMTKLGMEKTKLDLDARLTKLRDTLSAAPGNTPASSASTPAPTPSATSTPPPDRG